MTNHRGPSDQPETDHASLLDLQSTEWLILQAQRRAWKMATERHPIHTLNMPQQKRLQAAINDLVSEEYSRDHPNRQSAWDLAPIEHWVAAGIDNLVREATTTATTTGRACANDQLARGVLQHIAATGDQNNPHAANIVSMAAHLPANISGQLMHSRDGRELIDNAVRLNRRPLRHQWTESSPFQPDIQRESDLTGFDHDAPMTGTIGLGKTYDMKKAAHFIQNLGKGGYLAWDLEPDPPSAEWATFIGRWPEQQHDDNT